MRVGFFCAIVTCVCLAAVVSVAAPPKPSPTPAQSAKQFIEADRDGNGSVSKEEFEAYFLAHPGALPAPRDSTYAEQHGFGAEPSPTPEKKTGDPVTRAISEYFSVHKSFLSGTPKDALDPARISWSAPKGKDSTYTLDLSIQGKNNWIIAAGTDKGGAETSPLEFQSGNWELGANLIFEAHVSTIAATSRNQLLYQGLLQLDVTSKGENPFIIAHHLYLRPMYETDRKADIQTKRLDFDYSPDLDLFGWGQHTPLGDLSSHRQREKPLKPEDWVFYFRPFFGLELHSVDEGLEKIVAMAKLPGLEEEYGFFRLSLVASLQMTDRFALTTSWVHRTELFGGGGSHSYLEVTGLAILDEARHYSFGASYKRGEESPLFEDLNVVEAFVGFTF